MFTAALWPPSALKDKARLNVWHVRSHPMATRSIARETERKASEKQAKDKQKKKDKQDKRTSSVGGVRAVTQRTPIPRSEGQSKANKEARHSRAKHDTRKLLFVVGFVLLCLVCCLCLFSRFCFAVLRSMGLVAAGWPHACQPLCRVLSFRVFGGHGVAVYMPPFVVTLFRVCVRLSLLHSLTRSPSHPV